MHIMSLIYILFVTQCVSAQEIGFGEGGAEERAIFN